MYLVQVPLLRGRLFIRSTYDHLLHRLVKSSGTFQASSAEPLPARITTKRSRAEIPMAIKKKQPEMALN